MEVEAEGEKLLDSSGANKATDDELLDVGGMARGDGVLEDAICHSTSIHRLQCSW